MLVVVVDIIMPMMVMITVIIIIIIHYKYIFHIKETSINKKDYRKIQYKYNTNTDSKVN